MYDAIFLDCDGVVTDRRARVDSRVIFEAYRLAHSGKRVAFVTGRSLDWLSRNIVPAIVRFNPSPEEKGRFLFIGECGNRWLSFSSGGLAHGMDDALSVPESIRARVREDAKRFPYLFFDETKESFISLEVRHEKLVSPQADGEAQRQVDEASGFFSSGFPGFNVMRTIYAVDITAKGVGKASAARRALELIGSASSILIIGDSVYDLEMGEELQRHGIDFRFCYVGESPLPHKPFEVKKTASPYAEGTLEALREVR